MTAAEVLGRFSALGVTVRLADDGTLRVRRRDAERHPVLVEELRARRREAAEILRDGQVVPFRPNPDRALSARLSACPSCHGSNFWISLALIRICERCHPPADQRLVARREREPESLPR